MSESFDILDATIFWAGADGPPGQRVFYLVVGRSGDLVFLKCEKQQVAALAEYLEGLLDDLDPTDEMPADHGSVAAGELSWIVGSLAVAFDEPNDRIVVVAEEVVEEGEEPATARIGFTRAQASGFVRHANALVASGRPACRFCGLPVDPEGHPCPKMN